MNGAAGLLPGYPAIDHAGWARALADPIERGLRTDLTAADWRLAPVTHARSRLLGAAAIRRGRHRPGASANLPDRLRAASQVGQGDVS